MTSPVSNSVQLTLFQRDECHLCELAWEVLASARVSDFESVYIDGEAALEREFGLRVPVLRLTRAATNAESRTADLDWPFDAERVRALLAD